MALPVLYIVIPCYNEEAVLPLTSGLFLGKLTSLIAAGRVARESRVFFVNDGSKDGTWPIIQSLSREAEQFEGISLSRNRGHQNALLAGLMTARKFADVTISIDCDGQDDIDAMDAMLAEYEAGCEVVYGVRSKRDTDTFFKRGTAEGFYKLMKALGVDVVFNHADYRLLSRRALDGLAQFGEVNLFLRGMVPLVGFRSSSVYYERHERMAGESHYPFKKMLAFALDGITSLSVKPIRLITWLGFIFALVSFLAGIGIIIQTLLAPGSTVWGWSSTICAIVFMGGIQLLCVGVIGEYVGKIYNETKARPRYIVSEATYEDAPGGKPAEKPAARQGGLAMWAHILFDLDGTLTDPAEGITGSVRYALEQMGRPVPQRAVLERFIGPPLDEAFPELCGLLPDETARAITLFREYFTRQGINENELYPGMGSLLRELCEAGRKLYVATSKPGDFAHIILNTFGIAQYFTLVRGSALTHAGHPKAQVVAEVLADARIAPAEAVMVGDRCHDVAGAHACGLPCVGVRFGYAAEGELEAAGADYIANDLPDLRRILLGH